MVYVYPIQFTDGKIFRTHHTNKPAKYSPMSIFYTRIQFGSQVGDYSKCIHHDIVPVDKPDVDRSSKNGRRKVILTAIQSPGS